MDSTWHHRLLLILAVSLIGAALYPAVAPAATYHVSPSGSDAATGASDSPFATIGRAARAARSGDTVLVAPGRYAEQVNVPSTASGATFRRGGSTRPVLDGEGRRQYGFMNQANRVTIEGFEIRGQVEAGVYTRGVDNRVASNLIHHVGSQSALHSKGVQVVWGSGARVYGNTIHSIGPGGESMGVWLLQTRDALVDHNEIYLVRKEGVRDWMGLDNRIDSNRVFLNWTGLSFNNSTGSVATNNYVYDNVEGLIAKHTSHSSVLRYWNTTARWSRFLHNTVYRSTESALWLAQSGDPADYLDIRNNVFSDAGVAYIRDIPQLRGTHTVVDGNLYGQQPGRSTIYRSGWGDGGVLRWDAVRSTLGWERNGRVGTPGFAAPDVGDLDYGQSVTGGGVDVGGKYGSQLGARGLGRAAVRWTPHRMRPVDSSSKGTWWTKTQLGATVDNNVGSYWLTSTPSNEYVTYDLGEPRTISHILVSIYQHWDVRNPRGYRFEVSNDGTNWRTARAGTNPDTQGASYSYELSQPVSARYLRYRMLDTSCTSYSPRAGCGPFFVFSDIQVGSLTGGNTVAAPPLPPLKRPPLRHGPGAKGARAKVARRVSLRTRRARVRRGRVRLSLSCSARRCRGSIALRVKRGLRGARAGSGTIARRRFRVRGGKRRVVAVRISRRALRSLRHRRTVRVRVRVASGGRSQARSVALLIRR